MNLHEYQVKNLFAKYSLPVPKGYVIDNINDVASVVSKSNTSNFVVKAQIHAGGRGKAGGVKLVAGQTELTNAVKALLGKRLVTNQTDQHGQIVNKLLIEETCNIKSELYLGCIIDRSLNRLMIMVSLAGGVNIEKVAIDTPEKIIKIYLDPLLGLMPNHCREVGYKLGFTNDQIKQFSKIIGNLVKMFYECDISFVEINPLAITSDEELLCLDGKISIDDNALFRQKELKALRDLTQEDERVNKAHEYELNYIPLDGNIGCMVNGAGLAMATMDIIKLFGGSPANFLDVGGNATEEKVKEAFKIISTDHAVAAILVNIFGGIVRCDLVADGIIAAVLSEGINVPVVVRLEGNNAQVALKKLNDSELNIIAADSLKEAAKKVINSIGID